MVSESIEKLVAITGSYEKLSELVNSNLGLKKPLTAMAVYQWKKRNSVPAKYISTLVDIAGGEVSVNDLIDVAA